MEALIAISGGAAVFLFLAYTVRTRALRPAEARLKLIAHRQVALEREGGELLLRRDPSTVPAISRFLDANGYAQRWARDLERADLSLRPGEYFLIRLILAAVAALVITALARNAPGFFIGVLVGAMVYMLPAYWLNFRIKRRLAKIESQLVETVTLIASALRSGFAFTQGIDVAAKRVGPPMATELNRMLLDINLGAAVEDALGAFNERLSSDDVDMVVTAVLIQRNTGGNLAEVLEQVTETIRDRERIQGEIKTLTAQQRLTGWVLSLWPLALAGMFLALNPEMMSLMWTTTAGWVLLVIWFVLNTLGIVALRRILDIEI